MTKYREIEPVISSLCLKMNIRIITSPNATAVGSAEYYYLMELCEHTF